MNPEIGDPSANNCRRRWVGIESVLLLVAACASGGTDTTRASGRVATIEMGERVAILGGQGKGELPGYPRQVIRLPSGRFLLLVGQGNDWTPVVVDSTGAKPRPLAAAGQGPGELSRVWGLVIGFDDTVRVMAMSRLSVFTKDLAFVRSVEQIKLIDQWPQAVLSSNLFLTRTDRWDATVNPWTVKAQTASGTVTKVLSLPGYSTGDVDRIDSTTFWAGVNKRHGSDGFELWRLDVRGERIGAPIIRKPGWWAASDTVNHKWGHYVAGLRADANGGFTVLIGAGNDSTQSYLERLDAYGELVASGVTPESPFGFVDRERFGTREVDADGFYTIRIWKP